MIDWIQCLITSEIAIVAVAIVGVARQGHVKVFRT